MGFSLYLYRRWVVVCIAVLATGAMVASGSLAQETGTSRELERVEVLPPDRRPTRAPATRTDRGAQSDEASSPSETPSRPDSTSPSQSTSNVGAATQGLVEGKSQVSAGAASLPAQVQTITSQEIQQLNVWGREPAELFMRVAGVNAYYYNNGAMGLGIGMRGFSSANDIGFWVDGVPQNYPSLAGQGRVLLQWLPSEAIEKIEIIKGPFSAMYGDFAQAGVVNIITKKSDPTSSVKVEGGSFGSFRGLNILSSESVVPTPFLVQEYYSIDGYRDNSENKQGTTFDKISFPLLDSVLSLRYNYFQCDWRGPGYAPLFMIKSGQWNRKRPVDPWDGGDVWQYQLVANYAPACGERGLYATAYMHTYHGMRYCKFMPLTSSEYARMEDRPYWGGRVYYNMVFGDIASLTIGGETRHDRGDNQQYNTVNRKKTSVTYEYSLWLANWAMFLQGQIKPHEKVKIVGGVRWDYFIQQFENQTQPRNSGRGTPYIRSPKIGFVMTPTDNLNFFGNIGIGFRTPAHTEVSPYSASGKANHGLDPAAVRTYDIGCNTTVFSNLYLAADYYHTYMEREIQTVNNEPVNIGNTVRKGYELEAKYYPSGDLDFFASYAWVDAQVVDPTTPGQFLLTYIPEHIIKAGFTMKRDFGPYGKVTSDLYYEYHSGAPVSYSKDTTTGRQVPLFAPDYDVYNMKLTYAGRGWSSFASARCQPREYSASYFSAYKVGNSALLTCDPPPKWEFTSGLSYSF